MPQPKVGEPLIRAQTQGDPGLLKRRMAYKLPGTASGDSSIETFVKRKTGISVLMKIDNTTAVAYINNQGETVSK